jgi:hypothetical protein
MNLRRITLFALAITISLAQATQVGLTTSGVEPGSAAKRVHHYVFFGQDREQLKEARSFLETPAFEGAQVAYSWRQLEQGKDNYDFSLIREDLAFLNAHGKKLWIQYQDVTFNPNRINVPKYLLDDPKYNGGADKQYQIKGDDEAQAVHEGWMARRYDPAVQERLHKLYAALGKEFDGRVVGINDAETSSGFGWTGKLFPKGYTQESLSRCDHYEYESAQARLSKIDCDGLRELHARWPPYLEAVYQAARESNVAVGGPDLMPFRPFQRANSYPLIRASAGKDTDRSGRAGWKLQ